MINSLDYSGWNIADLVPHKPPMVLISRILEATIEHIRVESNLGADCPFGVQGEDLPAWWAVEYLAQSVAVLAGLRERAAGNDVPEGYITSCRRFEASASVFSLDGVADITATELVAMDMKLGVFECEMVAGDFRSSATISVYADRGDSIESE